MQIHEKRKYFRIEILHVLYHLAHHIDWNIKKELVDQNKRFLTSPTLISHSNKVFILK